MNVSWLLKLIRSLLVGFVKEEEVLCLTVTEGSR